MSTGKNVELEKDLATGLMVRKDTKQPVEIYVDTKTHDTIYGPIGKVINGFVVKNNDGKYEYYDSNKAGTAEHPGNGEYTIKNGNYKKKVEGNGEYKIKSGDYKKKVEKDGDKKIKINGKTGERKVKTD